MTRIYLVRHAEAEGNLYRRIHGWYNSLITENGYRQIAALAERFKDIHIDAVYSSDLFRTMTTAGAVYKSKGLPLHTDPGLREVNLGWWEDRTWAETARMDGQQLELFNATSPDWKVKDGETFDQVRRRVGETLKKLAARHEGQTLAVFCHACAIRNTLAYLEGLSVAESANSGHSDNTAVSLLEFEGDQVRIVFRDDNSHLNEEISTVARRRRLAQRWDGDLRNADLWYRPMDLEREQELYYQFRREAWTTIHGEDTPFDGEAFLNSAIQHSRQDENAVVCAMSRDEQIMGVLQMDTQRMAEEQVGWIAFCYLSPEARKKGLGVQLLGQAVSYYRPLGRQYLRLRCAPHNEVAQRFYQRSGFYKVGQEPGGSGQLDVLEKYIGYEERE